MRVLIIDDDRDDLEMMSYCVREILPFADVVTLLGSPYVPGIDPSNYELLIIDERIGSYSGIEVCGSLRKQGFKGRIILITGDTSFQPDFDFFIRKDAQYSELRCLLRVLSERSNESN